VTYTRNFRIQKSEYTHHGIAKVLNMYPKTKVNGRFGFEYILVSYKDRKLINDSLVFRNVYIILLNKLDPEYVPQVSIVFF